MDYAELRDWLWADPRATPPKNPAEVLEEIEVEHIGLIWAEHRQANVRVLKQSARSPGDMEVVPRRVDAPSRCTVPELLDLVERVLVVGGRGSGKTELIGHLAAQAATDRFLRSPLIVPFVVPVSLLSEHRLDERTIARLSPIGGVLLVRRALEERRALVLVDGLDEAGDGVRALSDSIEAFARAHPGNRMVVTTRPRRTGIPGYTRVELPGFVTATLLPAPGTRVYAAHHFLGRRYPERRASLVAANVDALLRGPAGGESPAGALLDSSHSSLSSLDLAEQRILFGAVALRMHDFRLVEIPAEMLTETLLSRLRGARWVDGRLVLDKNSEHYLDDDEDDEDLDDDEDDEDDLDDDQDQDGEEALLRGDRVGPAPREAAGSAGRDWEPLLDDIEGLVERIVQELRSHQGLLVERRPGFFVFADFAYQEYLTAQEHIRFGLVDKLVERRDDGWWHDTIVFAAGAEEVDVAAFLQKMLAADHGEAPVATLLAARCAEVAAGPLPPRLGRRISSRLKGLVPPRNGINVAHLIDVGDIVGPALVRSLGSAAPSERAHTATVLGSLSYQPAYRVLMRMAADTTPVTRAITHRVWTDELVVEDQPVGYYALAALFNIALISTTARKIFEQALKRVPSESLRLFQTVLDDQSDPVFDTDPQQGRDAATVRVFLKKIQSVLHRTPLPTSPY